jgi:hypothetical protein
VIDMGVFNLLKQFLPTILELFEHILGLDDEEFEQISSSWPAPIKMKIERLRFEAKLLVEFPDKKEDPGA